MQPTREALPLPRAIAPDQEIVAIGDIHGRSDLLDALLAEAEREPRLRPSRKLVFLGDLVDRGPDALGALALAREAAARLGADEAIPLFGNHEILMRLTLDPAKPTRLALGALAVWLRNGGDAVVEQLIGDVRWGDAQELLARLRQATPAPVADWLAALTPHWRSGGVLFVHGGVNPSLPLEDVLRIPWDEPLERLDDDAHWAWVRAPFLDHAPDERGFSGYFVVHGHTPLDRGHARDHAEQVRRFRLNLDGGSAMTGMAKLAILRDSLAEVVTVRAAL